LPSFLRNIGYGIFETPRSRCPSWRHGPRSRRGGCGSSRRPARIPVERSATGGREDIAVVHECRNASPALLGNRRFGVGCSRWLSWTGSNFFSPAVTSRPVGLFRLRQRAFVAEQGAAGNLEPPGAAWPSSPSGEMDRPVARLGFCPAATNPSVRSVQCAYEAFAAAARAADGLKPVMPMAVPRELTITVAYPPHIGVLPPDRGSNDVCHGWKAGARLKARWLRP
jgi:hypothetical protein